MQNFLTKISRKAGDWQGLAIKKRAATQELALDTSQPALKAAKWLALQLLREIMLFIGKPKERSRMISIGVTAAEKLSAAVVRHV